MEKLRMVMAPRKPVGSNPREAAEGKAPQMPGNTAKPKGKWTEVSADY